MANIIDSLLITLGLDAKGFDQGVNQAAAQVQAGSQKIVAGFDKVTAAENKVRSSLGMIGKALAGFAGFQVMRGMFNDYINTADALSELAWSFNSTITDLDAWGQATARAGGTAQGFQASLGALNDQIQQVRELGTGRSKKVFEELGIALKPDDTPISVLQKLAQSADKFDKVKFAGLAKKLGLDRGTIMLLQKGEADVSKLVGEMKDLAYTEEDAKAAGDYDDAMQHLSKTVQMGAAIFFRLLAPALKSVLEAVQKVVKFLRDNERFTIAIFAGMAAAITMLLLPAIIAAGAAIWAALAPLLPFIALLALLVLLFDDFMTYIEGGESELEEYWSILGTGEEISKRIGDTWEWLKKTGTDLWDKVKRAADWFFDTFGPALDALGTMFKGALQVIKGIFDGDFNKIKEGVKNIFNGMGALVIGIFEGAAKTIYDVFHGIFKKIADYFGETFDAIYNKVVNFIKKIVSKIPPWLLPDGVLEWANSVEEKTDEINKNTTPEGEPAPTKGLGVMRNGVTSVATDVNSALKTFGEGASLLGIDASAAAREIITQNTTETTVNAGGITINAQTNDPAAIGTAVSSEIRKLANAGNKGVRQ